MCYSHYPQTSKCVQSFFSYIFSLDCDCSIYNAIIMCRGKESCINRVVLAVKDTFKVITAMAVMLDIKHYRLVHDIISEISSIDETTCSGCTFTIIIASLQTMIVYLQILSWWPTVVTLLGSISVTRLNFIVVYSFETFALWV